MLLIIFMGLIIINFDIKLVNMYTFQEGLVKLLLDAGANIDAQSVNGGTPIMRAIETSQKDIVKLLIERGYDAISPLP